MKITIELEEAEISLLCEALDSHEYWQLSDESERSNGSVILPEDRELYGAGPKDEDDQDDQDEDQDDDDDEEEEEDENHEEIRACRRLSEKLSAAKRVERAEP